MFTASEEIERWRVVPTHPNYSISDRGRISYPERTVRAWGGFRLVPASISSVPGGLHYKYVRFGLTEKVYLHRLVAQLFIANPLNLPEVNHIDGIRGNCDWRNLEWSSHADNCLHGCRVLKKRLGSNHGQAKLVEEDIPVIFKLRSMGQTLGTIAVHFGVCRQTIADVLSRRNWGHLVIADHKGAGDFNPINAAVRNST